MTALYTLAMMRRDSDRALTSAHWHQWEATLRYRINWWFCILAIAPIYFTLAKNKGATSIVFAVGTLISSAATV